MGTVAVALRENRAARFWDSANGKKAVMAVTGAMMFGFVLLHMAGNLQIFEGPDQFNKYAQLLRTLPEALWAARLVLLAAVAAHTVAAVQLALRNRRARPVSYSKKEAIASTYASRTMYWSGPIVLAFIIYHLLHFTFGITGVPEFIEGDVYHNVVNGFQNPIIAAWYVLAMLLLCLHLQHGISSMFQTLGISHPRYTPWLEKAAALLAVVIFVGFVSVPLSVVLGYVR
jgi:succinate dehydrogenase / fumarate reductase, cytochrome b subunit